MVKIDDGIYNGVGPSLRYKSYISDVHVPNPQVTMQLGSSNKSQMYLTIVPDGSYSGDEFEPKRIPTVHGVYEYSKLSPPRIIHPNQYCDSEMEYPIVFEHYNISCNQYHDFSFRQDIKQEIPKGETFCFIGSALMASKQKYSVEVRTFTGYRTIPTPSNRKLSEDYLDYNNFIDPLSGYPYEHSTTPQKFKNPLLIRDKRPLMAITCDDDVNCSMEIMKYSYGKINTETFPEDLYVISNQLETKVEFNIDNKVTSLLLYNKIYKPIDITKEGNINIYQFNEELILNEQYFRSSNYYLIMNQNSDFQGKITFNCSGQAIFQSIMPAFIGKVPSNGLAFTLNELINEYKNPGSYDPTKSEFLDKPPTDPDDEGKDKEGDGKDNEGTEPSKSGEESDQNGQKSGKLSGGALAGIIVGVIAVITIVVVVVIFLIIKKSHNDKQTEEMEV
ncbi:hypothetical protein TVAG_093190 [Trichomonas vaginalis G3]|uniref:Uncharacterized protein n=1 Tax=Trichomonas vaginalis (strain ATCC PRA-98 / G3) TaxID=412133 RepID=A2DBE2_TRIV3|nr:glycoprotein 38 family [Trichomonas vaginalis G3]EAY22145.1 hypothetical protein TVAG_093190 [Trichomonas vaginalis G3]KAI5533407.1 glycoprotein 38 family [Trichomonas vaginalis G3]|eukprot:XP_001583131.1 hypothetical protein [Trichomonas vaginalis G3]